MDLGQAEPSTVVSNRLAPVLAIADGPKASVLHWRCDGDGPEGCTLLRTRLPIEPGNEVMITADGRHVVAIDRTLTRMLCFEVDPEGAPGTVAGCFPEGTSDDFTLPADDTNVEHLVTSLRGSSVVIARDAGHHLLRYRPGLDYSTRLGSSTDDDFTVVAVGRRHVVASRTIDDHDEELYVIEVLGHDGRESDDTSARKLIHARAFRRVVIDPHDERVIATSGTGSTAETFVFDIATAYLLDPFPGLVASGRVAHEDIPGLRPISPDGSHFAYRTPSGAAALRNLDAQSSCLVRSATHGGHDVVAFSADGVVYLESETGLGKTRLQSWNPATRHLAALAEPGERLRLAAAPARRIQGRAWAVGVRDGNYVAVQEASRPHSLDLGDAMFLPRDDERLWVANSALESSDTVRKMTLRRVDASLGAGDRSYAFPTDSAVEVVDHEYDPADRGPSPKPHPFKAVFSDSTKVCFSTGTPGSRASQCGAAKDDAAFAGTAPPASAHPDNGDPFEPDLPPS